jgi:hypothetical protein
MYIIINTRNSHTYIVHILVITAAWSSAYLTLHVMTDQHITLDRRSWLSESHFPIFVPMRGFWVLVSTRLTLSDRDRIRVIAKRSSFIWDGAYTHGLEFEEPKTSILRLCFKA